MSNNKGALVVLALVACSRQPASGSASFDASPSASAASAVVVATAGDAAAAPGLPWPDPAVAFDSGYAGRIGETITFRAQIKKTGAALDGYYRYPKSNSDLKLAGTVDPRGHFTLTETSDVGAVTGRWEGTFRSARSASGTWTSADGARHLAFTLTGAAHLAPFAGGDAQIDMRREERDAGAGCTNTLSWAVVSGLVPQARNAAVNATLARIAKEGAAEQVSCSGSESGMTWWSDSSVTITAQVPGYLSVDIGWSGYSGGVHPLGGSHCALIDTRGGTEASLVAILGPSAVTAIADRVSTLVAKFLKECGLPADGDKVSAPVDDAHLCYVNGTTIEVRYSSYEVAPYVCGGPSFPIDVTPLVGAMPAGIARGALFGK